MLTSDFGCGKSVLVRSLVDEMPTFANGKHRIVCYFFFTQMTAEEGSVTEAMCAMLHQIFTQAPHLLRPSVERFAQHSHHIHSRFNDL